MLTFGSLFAGIGGFDLGFERAGMKCLWQVEIDDYANRVLAKHWPDVRRHGDVCTWPQPDTEPVDVICGGFPCQDISNAGKRAGLDGNRSGLFYEIIRIAGELRPRFIVLENVSALLNRGFDRVLGELATLGYDAEWHCIPASAVGAPHQRDRVWIVAYPAGLRGRSIQGQTWKYQNQRIENSSQKRPFLANAPSQRQQGPGQPFQRSSQETHFERQANQSVSIGFGDFWAVEPAVGRNPDGFPRFLDRHVGRGMSHEESKRAVEGLRSMWNEHVSQAVQRAIGGLDRIQAAAVLFSLMREYSKGGRIPREFMEGTEALESALRNLRRIEEARSTPQRQKQEQQHGWQHPDVVRDVPREIASWDTFECGIPRVASNVPNRVDRLRCLGNAIVPQVAELVGRRVIEIAGMDNR